MHGPQLTEERLRSWLDANQVQRERMCIALLSLNRKYTNIKPRRPKGGPDGGRDIEALYEEKYTSWGAVGFRNSVSDSPADKRWLKEKFIGDVERATSEKQDLKSFVFFTNVDLTPSEESELVLEAKGRGVIFIDIFYRERLRILLDGPEGLGLRFQYLGISLSDAEQAAFFERFGTQLESLLLRRFDNIDQKLSRIEFLQDCSKLLLNIGIYIELHRDYSSSELGHFRFLIEIVNDRDLPMPKLLLCGRDWKFISQVNDEEIIRYGESVTVWSEVPDEQLYGLKRAFPSDQENEIGFFADLHKSVPFARLGDLDQCSLHFFTTKPLFDKIKSIALVANNYILAAADVENLVSLPGNSLEDEYGIFIEWPEELSEEEDQIPWSIVLLRDDSSVLFNPSIPLDEQSIDFWDLNLSRFTPEKLD
jgi:hypothetical protein